MITYLVLFLLTSNFYQTVLAAGNETSNLPDNDILTRAQLLAVKLSRLEAETMQTQELEDLFADAEYQDQPLDSEALSKELAEGVLTILQKKIDAVGRIAHDAEEAYAKRVQGSEGIQCTWESAYRAIPAADSDPETAQRFNLSRASINYPTVRTAPGVHSNSVLDTICAVEPAITDTFETNYEDDPNLAWQYVGTQDGVMMMFPGTEQMRDPRTNAYNEYDPRIRPWYAGASSGPRDVILVLDKSGSMQDQGRLPLMKSAAKAVLDTITAQDYVQVILFDSSAKSSKCLPERLVRGIPENIKVLTEFIDDAGADGGTNFDDALNLAFNLMDATERNNVGTGCRTAILFLTDGIPQDGQDGLRILDSRLKDADGKPKATIFTYALGANAELQDEIACQSGGTYSQISDGGDLRGQMSGYFMLFAQGLKREDGSVFWSAPYLDSSGMGMMVTAAVPFYDEADSNRRKLVGVAGVDVPLTELEALVEKMEGDHSYAFVVNHEGEVIFHPELPHSSHYLEPPVYQDISELEQGVIKDSFDSVRAGLISGQRGSETIRAIRRIDRGDSAYEGYDTTEIMTTYTWEPAGPFTVCYVIAEGEKTQTKLVGAFSDVPSYYHHSLLDPEVAVELDVRVQPSDDPIHPDVLMTRETASIKLAPRAFVDTAGYLSREETLESANAIQDYFELPDAANPGLVVGVYDDVQRTGNVSSLWHNIEFTPEGDGVTWLYVGTPLSIRIYPAFVHPNRAYDPTQRTWYKRALANRGDLALSTPYEDSFGAGRVVTISKTIVLHDEASEESVGGVVGLDFTYPQFRRLVDEAAQCNDGNVFCFVMDSSGYLISYDADDFSFSELLPLQNSENVFVGLHEPGVAQDLIDKGVLKHRTYYDPRSEMDCSTYVVDDLVIGAEGYVQGVLTGCHTGTYRMTPVENYDSDQDTRTNLYLVAVESYRSRSLCTEQIKATCSPPAELTCSQHRSFEEDDGTRGRNTGQCPVFELSSDQLEEFRSEETGFTCAAASANGANGVSPGANLGLIIGLVSLFWFWP